MAANDRGSDRDFCIAQADFEIARAIRSRVGGRGGGGNRNDDISLGVINVRDKSIARFSKIK